MLLAFRRSMAAPPYPPPTSMMTERVVAVLDDEGGDFSASWCLRTRHDDRAGVVGVVAPDEHGLIAAGLSDVDRHAGHCRAVWDLAAFGLPVLLGCRNPVRRQHL